MAGGSEPPTSPGSPPDFGPLAEDYDRLRPADDNWWELVDALVEAGDLRGRRVLDVGCGTGLLSLALADRGVKVWGVDASEEMLAQARAAVGRRVGLKLGRAESLPFKDGWFERVVLRLVVHLVDRAQAFPEIARVLAPGGRALVATYTPNHFEWFWLTSVFPEVRELDRARFPTPEALVQELRAAGFGSVRVRTLRQRTRLGREEALERIRGRYISTLRLLDEATFAAGLERAERGLPETIESPLEWAVVAAERPAP
ncbi:MAG: class I SAM-dependent methyltransferase [Gaiellaceae bacterium]